MAIIGGNAFKRGRKGYYKRAGAAIIGGNAFKKRKEGLLQEGGCGYYSWECI